MFIDVADEWYDLIGLPFVYAFWAVHEMDMKQIIIKKIRSLVEHNLKNLGQTLNSIFSEKDRHNSEYSDFISHKIAYHIGLEEREAITEFFRYAFFFGCIDHIPDLNFCD